MNSYIKGYIRSGLLIRLRANSARSLSLIRLAPISIYSKEVLEFSLELHAYGLCPCNTIESNRLNLPYTLWIRNEYIFCH